MKKIAAAVAALALVLGLSACEREVSPTPAKGTYGEVAEFTVKVDGRDVQCISWVSLKVGSISCDWHPNGK